MEKIPYSEQIRRGYNYLAGRVNELKADNKKLEAENAKLRELIFRATFGGRLSCDNARVLEVWSELYAKEIEVEDAKRTGPVIGPVAVELNRMHCDNGGIKNA